MRVKSKTTHGYTIYTVLGTNTISFAIDFRNAQNESLLGFAVERIDHKYGERKEDVIKALSISDLNFSQAETYIRDCFDYFFYYTHLI